MTTRARGRDKNRFQQEELRTAAKIHASDRSCELTLAACSRRKRLVNAEIALLSMMLARCRRQRRRLGDSILEACDRGLSEQRSDLAGNSERAAIRTPHRPLRALWWRRPGLFSFMPQGFLASMRAPSPTSRTLNSTFSSPYRLTLNFDKVGLFSMTLLPVWDTSCSVETADWNSTRLWPFHCATNSQVELAGGSSARTALPRIRSEMGFRRAARSHRPPRAARLLWMAISKPRVEPHLPRH